MHDEPLTPEEKAAFDRLPKAIAPPDALEERVVADLGRAGLIRPRRARRRWLQAAAAVILVATGVVMGRLTASSQIRGSGNTYLMLLYGDVSKSGRGEAELFAEYSDWARMLRDRRQLVAAERLSSATVVFGASSGTGSPSPVGFFLIRAESLEAASATVARSPHVKHGGTVVLSQAR